MKDIKMMRLTIGEKISLLRQKEGRSIEEVAEFMKMTVGTYEKIEDDFLYPKDEQIARLGRLYGLTYEQVISVGEE